MGQEVVFATISIKEFGHERMFAATAVFEVGGTVQFLRGAIASSKRVIASRSGGNRIGAIDFFEVCGPDRGRSAIIRAIIGGIAFVHHRHRNGVIRVGDCGRLGRNIRIIHVGQNQE